MLSLPVELLPFIIEFQPLFSKPVFQHAKLLLVGAILAIGKRTVSSCLRVMGLAHDTGFQNYHRVLNRARWSALAASRILLRLLIAAFAPTGELVCGLDDTIERRRGQQIKAKGIYRDPVRSSHSHFVKASGLRWLCCMLLVEVSWAGAVWGLPFLSVLCPSERYYKQLGRPHRKLTDRAAQIIKLVGRWLPSRAMVFVADSSFATFELLALVSGISNLSLVTRLRLDAQLWDEAPARKPGQIGRPRLKGKRLASPQQVLEASKTKWMKIEVERWYGGGKREVEVHSETAIWYKTGQPPVEIRWLVVRDPLVEFEPQALMTTNLDHTPVQMLTWFVRRWRMEVTFEEARAHLGMETQRQWNGLAIARSTPIVLGMFSVVTMMASGLIKAPGESVRTAAWYAKELPTFADAIAIVRRSLWSSCHFSTSSQKDEVVKIPRALLERLTDAVCYAA
jgi:DDE superfamily endonuclease